MGPLRLMEITVRFPGCGALSCMDRPRGLVGAARGCPMTASRSRRGVAPHLLRLARAADNPPEPDAQLLARFAAERDEAAFAALVERHGPTVLGVCRRVLGDAHAAEDAFQAACLALARNAGRVRDPGALAAW